MHEELMNCLSHFLKTLPIDSLMILQMAESTRRLHLVFSDVFTPKGVIVCNKIIPSIFFKNKSEDHMCNSLQS